MFYLIKLKAENSKFVVLPADKVGLIIEKVGENVEHTVTIEGGALYTPEEIEGLKMLNAEEVKLSI